LGQAFWNYFRSLEIGVNYLSIRECVLSLSICFIEAFYEKQTIELLMFLYLFSFADPGEVNTQFIEVRLAAVDLQHLG